MVEEWQMKKNTTKREIPLLVEVLQHATKVVCLGRLIVSTMYAMIVRVVA